MPQRDNNEAFLFVTPPRSRIFIFFASRKAQFLHFLTLFDRSPYLVLLGARPTVLGHSLEKYESSAILSGRPSPVKIITSLIAYRQPPPPKQKFTENSIFLFKNLGNFRNLRTLKEIANFFNFGQNIFDYGKSLLIKDGNNYSKTKRKELQTV